MAPRPDRAVAGTTVREWLAQQHEDQRDECRHLLRARLGAQAHDTATLPDALRAQLELEAARLHDAEPLAYVLGEQPFHDVLLQTDARALAPRNATECLVERALELLAAYPASSRVLDLGTGSGAIAIAIARARPDLEVVATDISSDALALAAENARRNQVTVRLFVSDWFSAIRGRFDLIVSNPPYVCDDDPHLAALRHEPARALEGGPDGLDALRTICAAADAHLHAGAGLLLEHGWDQGPAVRALVTVGGLTDVATHRDLAGHERVTGGRKAES